ncbi:hypothetical protein N7509_004853 [Penicillium cosmopolitanum]|uniref:Arabinan endo-1,5-alpha-L-arabinosidase n=1 Tax=Penicillium cosmopolitanum TaxID=1131564 RepID=A0A9W9W140_9EURO|nr:uncharacterized protein N7509_004853 [Penicillium cosmopolitanum]KAJ5396740.1 hypothetical protein N7509_004853 [Penicillium cosmopolitanum]
MLSNKLRTLVLVLGAALVDIKGVGAAPASQGSWKSALSQVFETTDRLPLPNLGNLVAHDPNIVQHDDHYYLFKGGHHVPIFKADNLSGPWAQIGTVLDDNSIIDVGNRSRPWAPTTIFKNGTFYCYYTLSTHGSRNSAIGVATTTKLDGTPWKDHGAVIRTGEGKGSDVFPFTQTNAIDASFITDQETGKSYLNYGSFWHNIWQIPLADDLLSIEEPQHPDAVQLTFMPDQKVKPEEGSWMSYHDGYYYTWFSRGQCCKFGEKEGGFPSRGQEYNIHVGRSRNVRGPFVDKDGDSLVDGGGTAVYASNHGLVYAPGGLGVLAGNDSTPDILYYHYLNTSIGFKDGDARLGWNVLKYEDGWPEVTSVSAGSIFSLPSWLYLTTLMGFWLCIWS